MTNECDVTVIKSWYGWMDGSRCWMGHAGWKWNKSGFWANYSDQTAGWSPQMLVKSKGISQV